MTALAADRILDCKFAAVTTQWTWMKHKETRIAKQDRSRQATDRPNSSGQRDHDTQKMNSTSAPPAAENGLGLPLPAKSKLPSRLQTLQQHQNPGKAIDSVRAIGAALLRGGGAVPWARSVVNPGPAMQVPIVATDVSQASTALQAQSRADGYFPRAITTSLSQGAHALTQLPASVQHEQSTRHAAATPPPAPRIGPSIVQPDPILFAGYYPATARAGIRRLPWRSSAPISML
ncbi:hypothetical protein S7711_11001 [Stachybotrys chartarum IBT 7711]|uniref:Uncharacterized protein n=1 Tax=Stachybotrys chartarum (strain CBS 109288 / IBT 7711) TaxID=1280523 RepID=A0A084B1Y7_STACB|nr:hypothetical protein S7711_11001 [Stachybotrys chartarum IBT 7711]